MRTCNTRDLVIAAYRHRRRGWLIHRNRSGSVQQRASVAAAAVTSPARLHAPVSCLGPCTGAFHGSASGTASKTEPATNRLEYSYTGSGTAPNTLRRRQGHMLGH